MVKSHTIFIHKSLKAIETGVFDNTAGRVVISIKLPKTGKDLLVKTAKTIGGWLKENKVTEVNFNRNGYRYHGHVKEIADSIRNEGIKF